MGDETNVFKQVVPVFKVLDNVNEGFVEPVGNQEGLLYLGSVGCYLGVHADYGHLIQVCAELLQRDLLGHHPAAKRYHSDSLGPVGVDVFVRKLEVDLLALQAIGLEESGHCRVLADAP